LNETKHDKAIEKRRGDLNLRIHKTSTMWKILSPTRITDQAQEEDLHPEEGEGEEDPRNSQITIQDRTSTASIMEEDIAPKGAQKPKRTLPKFSKRRQ
jgi:hypothetical protein